MFKKVLIISMLCCIVQHACAGDEDAEAPAPVIKYVTPWPSGEVNFAEPFDSDDAIDSWTLSKADKEGVASEISKYNGKWVVEAATADPLPGDMGLVLKQKAKHHAISSKLDRPFVFDTKPFVMQYEVNFQDGIECGGAYVKLLTDSDGLKLTEFHDKTPYTIMFGPDKCGEDYKLHFIFRHKNPVTGEFEEKHAKKPSKDFKSYYTDKSPHLYTLVLNPDNSFQIFIDQTEINSGSLLTDVQPAVNPPKEIEDKDDKKPSDWDDRATIPDDTATKPDDWDESAPAKIPDPSAEMPEGWLESEPLYVDDPDAKKPEDWDDSIDGEWEAPKIDNPKCKEGPGCGVWEPPTIANPAFKGKWSAPMIANPNYKGIWKPRMIANPAYFEDNEPFKMTSIGAIGLELWTMSDNIFFDNMIICSDKSVADDYAEKTWKVKKQARADAEPGVLKNLVGATEERPWLWIIYIVVIGLPCIMLIAFCCRGGKKEEDHKKTDEPTPDDPHDSEKEEADDEESKGSEEAGESPQEEKADGATDGDAEATTRADLEEEEKEEQEEEDAEEEGGDNEASGKKSPRKRKPRVQD